MQENSKKTKLPPIIASAGHFRHEAMATVIEIYIVHDDHVYAAQAAQAAFTAINRLESLLSRFIENSDTSRINNLKANQEISVGLDTFEILTNKINISGR